MALTKAEAGASNKCGRDRNLSSVKSDCRAANASCWYARSTKCVCIKSARVDFCLHIFKQNRCRRFCRKNTVCLCCLHNFWVLCVFVKSRTALASCEHEVMRKAWWSFLWKQSSITRNNNNYQPRGTVVNKLTSWAQLVYGPCLPYVGRTILLWLIQKSLITKPFLRYRRTLPIYGCNA